MENSACSFTSISAGCEAEMMEKKSRFICRLVPIDNVSELEDVLGRARVNYPSATHYCWACLIRVKNGLLERYSDDGEPSGTAGMPILTVLKNSGLENVMAIVIRYFGGTLLGTGGLVRAYTQAVQLALREARVINHIFCRHVLIEIDYSLYGFFEKNLRSCLLAIDDSQFAAAVTINGWLPIEKQDAFQHQLMETSGGTAIIDYKEQAFIPDLTKRS